MYRWFLKSRLGSPVFQHVPFEYNQAGFNPREVLISLQRNFTNYKQRINDVCVNIVRGKIKILMINKRIISEKEYLWRQRGISAESKYIKRNKLDCRNLLPAYLRGRGKQNSLFVQSFR